MHGMAKSIHSEFAEAKVGKHVSAHTLSPPTLHIMPLGEKRKRANNLGKYSQKKLHVDPSPTTESIHTIPLEHTQTVGDDVLPDWPDANVNSNSYDGANSDADSDTDLDETINPAISSKNAFSQCLHDTEEQLAQLANIRGKIPGNKVTYAGTTINGVRSERSRTRIDRKKRTILDFFNPPPTSGKESGQAVLSALLNNLSTNSSGRNSAITQIDLTQGEEEKETCSSEAAESNVFVAEMEMRDISPDDQQSESTWSPTHSPAATPLSVLNQFSVTHNNTPEKIDDALPEPHIPPVSPVIAQGRPLGTEEEPSKAHFHSRPYVPPPKKKDAAEAVHVLDEILKPPRKTGRGYKSVDINLMVQVRVQQMAQLLHLYGSSVNNGDAGWIGASLTVAKVWNRGNSYAACLRSWCRTFLLDKSLPENPYGHWGSSVLVTDEDLKAELETHLHGLGPYISASDIVEFLNTPEMKERMECEKPISLRTAQRWLHIMGYQWRKEKKGQYSDGHECEDVVNYWQTVFLPAMAEYAKSTRKWDMNGEEELPESPPEQHTVLWFHEESIFYAHDRRRVRWVHNSETPKPYPKGEGASLMVSDFVSADYGGMAVMRV
ncbi:uncharacterized protein EI90DRAFT_3152738 [Cantharellus anzutake]|uniref:uncharacterized protein n=1 Tax=Cantharellus anzutake TaxID=1750568 RepID=UPI0019055F12|nr:uncharacterized protein EI90DRAFT_3152738 [Cantharellus anzutake]KAF8335676.1 hypothetical protein EI90DRAFT_3152738 [Cantharellus anzutake]